MTTSIRLARLGAAFILAAGMTAFTGAVSGAALAHDDGLHKMEAARAEAIAKAFDAFYVSLSEEQREAVAFSLDDNEARTSWSNLPTALSERVGLSVSNLTDAQRIALHDLIATSMSSQGYMKTAMIMWSEDKFHELSKPRLDAVATDDPQRAFLENLLASFSTEEYYISLFNEAAVGGDFGFTLTGHHLGANFTVSDGRVGFTPLFLGAAPQVVPGGRHAGYRMLHHEADKALRLARSLTEPQKEVAVIAAEANNDYFTGKGRALADDAPRGIAANRLNADQQAMLMSLVAEYLDDAAEEAASVKRAAIMKDGMRKLNFAWWGPASEGAQYMYRISGPSILIEYIREPDDFGGYNHVHSIVRDPSNDFGADWLDRHYEEVHQEL